MHMASDRLQPSMTEAKYSPFFPIMTNGKIFAHYCRLCFGNGLLRQGPRSPLMYRRDIGWFSGSLQLNTF